MGGSSSRGGRSGEQAAGEAPPAGEASAEAQDAAAEPEPLDGSLGGVTRGYEELVNAIIRPPRMKYAVADLGPAAFTHCGKRFQREDIELTNSRGLKLACSWWKFNAADRPAQELPCVIYLHGNASCRIAACELLRQLLPCGITVFSMDFSGSGLSEGEHVSLGFFEREDVETAIAHLRGSGEVSTVALWGHSMGATAALLYGDRDPSIAAMVLDSPFADFMQLANELAQGMRENGLRVPGFAISVAASMIRRSVRRRAKFDPGEVSPLANCSKCFIPALFAHGELDLFIKPSHSEQLHEAYAGDKNLVLFDGDHNSARPEFLFDSAVIFLRQTLCVREEHCLDRSPGGALDSGLGLFSRGQNRLEAVRHAEDEMMRQAMMQSIAEQSQARAPASASRQAPQRPRVAASDLRKGVEEFKAIAGVGGATAEYYVEAALSSGSSLEAAIQMYFESNCAGPPPGWRQRAADLE